LRKILWDDTEEDVKVFMFVEDEQVGNKYRRKINGTSSRVLAGKWLLKLCVCVCFDALVRRLDLRLTQNRTLQQN